MSTFPYIYSAPEAFLRRYQLNHIYVIWSTASGAEKYTWKFDDVSQPSKIIYKREYTVNYPGWHEFERKIIKLNSDTIILTWPDENEFKGWIAYVPM
jgi:hypothetical protein